MPGKRGFVVIRPTRRQLALAEEAQAPRREAFPGDPFDGGDCLCRVFGTLLTQAELEMLRDVWRRIDRVQLGLADRPEAAAELGQTKSVLEDLVARLGHGKANV